MSAWNDLPFEVREKRKAGMRAYYLAHKEEMKRGFRAYQEKNRERLREYDKKRNANGRQKQFTELKRNSLRRARSQNRQRFRDRDKEYFRTNINARLTRNLRSRVRFALLGKNKSARTLALIGCSIDDLKLHLQSHFRPGMNWNNYGPVWVIDHHIPCAAHDLTNADEQKRCFHWSNLRPLFAHENGSKGDTHPLTGIRGRNMKRSLMEGQG